MGRPNSELMRGRRGAALATVLVVSGILLLLCLALASMCVLNLNLANAYSSESQALLLAQSAAAELVAEEEAQQRSTSGVRPNVLAPPSRFDLTARYQQQPVFPFGAQDLPGDIHITFDRANARDGIFSVDNLDGETAAPAYYDVGTSARSVPAFTIDLIMKITVRGQFRLFEAKLRRRWPYAVFTTQGPIALEGNPPASGSTTVNPTTITGDVYNLMQPPPNEADAGATEAGFGLFTHSIEEFLSGTLVQESFASLMRLQPDIPNGTAVAIGNDIKVFDHIVGSHQPTSLPVVVRNNPITLLAPGEFIVQDLGPSTTVTSTGNLLEGNVDIEPRAGNEVVNVATGNNFTGIVRAGIVRGNLPKSLSDLVTLPNADDPSFFPVPFQPVPEIVLPIPTTRPFYKLHATLVLNPQGPLVDPNSFVVQGHANYIINTSCGNRFFGASPLSSTVAQTIIVGTNAGLELNNCTLFVNGNLDLSADASDTSKAPPPLRGSGATLIVNGTLMLKDGTLDAQDQPMVIYCKQLIMQAKGNFRGLIISGGTASFFPPSDASDVLNISGGLVCSGAPVVVAAGLPPLTGVTLWSTNVHYDAKFLKTLNQFGDFEILSLQQRR